MFGLHDLVLGNAARCLGVFHGVTTSSVCVFYIGQAERASAVLIASELCFRDISTVDKII